MELKNQRETDIIITTKQWENEGEPVETQTVITAIRGISDGVGVIIYDLEDTLNVLMITDNYVKLVKSGDVEADMTFASEKMTETVFSASGRSLEFETFTKECKTGTDKNVLDLRYMLLSGGQPVAEYELNIREV